MNNQISQMTMKFDSFSEKYIYRKYCGKRGEIPHQEQILLFSTIFCNLILDFCFKTRTRFSLRDKRLFEITEVEITRVDCICSHIIELKKINNRCKSVFLVESKIRVFLVSHFKLSPTVPEKMVNSCCH